MATHCRHLSPTVSWVNHRSGWTEKESNSLGLWWCTTCKTSVEFKAWSCQACGKALDDHDLVGFEVPKCRRSSSGVER